MVHTLSQPVRSVRADLREDILDVAERLIRTKGYERMSVQEVQDELGVSRGAIYHYFGSKEALLEAVVERMTDAAMEVLHPIVSDPDTPAVQKLQTLFLVAGRWKSARRDLVLALLEVWLSDVNAVVRVKLRRMGLTRLVPMLEDIIRQGVAEGAFTVTSAEHAARVLWALLEGAGEAAGELLIGHGAEAIPLHEVRRTFAAYEEAVERVLGLPGGSFTYIDDQTLKVWFA
jgi:AcrR family transcriptional regulator